MRTKWAGLIVLALAALASLVWTSRTHTEAAPAPTASTTSSTADAPAVVDGSGQGHDQPSAAAPSGAANATPTASTAGSAPMETAPSPAAIPGDAVPLATEFAKAFARPSAGTPRDVWWAKVAPLMTPESSTQYAQLDPQQVPYQRITGTVATLAQAAGDPTSAGSVTRVVVPTDGGMFIVELGGAPLRVASMTKAPA